MTTFALAGDDQVDNVYMLESQNPQDAPVSRIHEGNSPTDTVACTLKPSKMRCRRQRSRTIVIQAHTGDQQHFPSDSFGICKEFLVSHLNHISVSAVRQMVLSACGRERAPDIRLLLVLH